MFALRNKVKFEKNQRAAHYGALFKKSEKETNKKGDNNSDGSDGDKDNVKRNQNNDVDAVKRQGSSLQDQADNIPLLKGTKNDDDNPDNVKDDKRGEALSKIIKKLALKLFIFF
jgi:hypothetical protein